MLIVLLKCKEGECNAEGGIYTLNITNHCIVQTGTKYDFPVKVRISQIGNF